jgi:hypothetical protein
VIKDIGQIVLTPPQKVTPLDRLQVDSSYPVAVNDALNLVGHTFTDVSLPPGGEFVGKIFWQTTHPVDKDYLLEFSFIDPNGRHYTIDQHPLSVLYSLPQWRKNEVLGAAYRLRVPAVAPPGNYPIVVTVLDPDTGQGVSKPVTLAQITVEAQERNFKLPEDVVPISAVINGQIELVGYKLLDETVGPRGTFGLTLYWRSLGFPEANYTVFVHAVGPDQSIRGQWDSIPAQGAAPTSGWIPGEIVEDHYEVPMAKKAPAWKYDILVGMYDPLTGQRLPMYSPNAPLSENRVWLSQVQLLEE